MAALDQSTHAPPAKHVLRIAYYYPPCGAAGVQRPFKFTKYLPAYGWQPHILTVSNGCFFAADDSVAANIPAHCEVTRAWSLEIARLGVLRRLRQRQSRNQHEVTPANPAVPQSLWRFLELGLKCLVGLPWIAESRDAWANNPMGHLLRRAVHTWLEAHDLQRADRVVSVTADLARKTSGPPHKYTVIANGYDNDDMPGGVARFEQPTIQASAPFVLTMAGSLYGRISAVPFYEGLAQFFNPHPSARRVTQVKWVGQLDHKARHEKQRAIARLGLGLAAYVHHAGYVAHRAVIEALCASDVLLLLLFAGEGAEQVMTGKLFAYLATQKPMLAMAQGTAAAELVQRCLAGIIIHPKDTTAIAKALGDLVDRRHLPSPNQAARQAALLPYTRRALTGQLAALLDDVTHTKRPS